ncbi:hypothetical protein YTPLAS21_21540 [Candidatus Nitrosocosmicus sp.]|nr:hypothetical protein YTPLAS21_21540 [Candidatus Nitrosocosmicus sp.]
MIDFTEIDSNGELWELFARDFLMELGFNIETQPDRGPDGGRDLLVTEHLKGNFTKHQFRWLVSCKHFAHSNRSVSETDEPNIQERLDSFQADGFIGFYSTISSSGLNNRLNSLRNNNRIKDFQIFDSELIKNYLIRLGYSKLLMRYLPESYKSVKPLHILFDKYVPLECDNCGKELLTALFKNEDAANIVYVIKDHKNEASEVIDVYCACLGKCDRILRTFYEQEERVITTWVHLSDYIIPTIYLQQIMAFLNDIYMERRKFSDKAFEKLKEVLLILGQKVLREMTEVEQQRVITLNEIQGL